MNVILHQRYVQDLRERYRVIHEQNLIDLRQRLRQDGEFYAKLVQPPAKVSSTSVDVRV